MRVQAGNYTFLLSTKNREKVPRYYCSIILTIYGMNAYGEGGGKGKEAVKYSKDMEGNILFSTPLTAPDPFSVLI